MTEKWLIENKISVRPRDNGDFDELIVMDGEHCIVHAEMMEDNCLWIGFYPKDVEQRRVCMWIRARGKLKIHAAED